jgi:hypothetical protein
MTNSYLFLILFCAKFLNEKHFPMQFYMRLNHFLAFDKFSFGAKVRHGFKN